MERSEECVCKQQGEKGEAGGSETKTEKGSREPNKASNVSRTSLQRPKAAGLEKTRGWEIKRTSKLRSYKQTSWTTHLFQRCDKSQSLGSKRYRRDTWQMKLKGHLSVSIKCLKKGRKQNTQPIIQMLTLKFGPSWYPAITIQDVLTDGKEVGRRGSWL